MADGPFTLAELLELPLPVPAFPPPAPLTNFQFPTVHFQSPATRVLQLTTRECASRLRAGSANLELLRRADVLFLLVRAGSIGWGEWGRTLYHNYLEQRELQRRVGELIQDRRIEVLAVTSDAVTAPLREVWLAKYGGGGSEGGSESKQQLAAANQGGR